MPVSIAAAMGIAHLAQSFVTGGFGVGITSSQLHVIVSVRNLEYQIVRDERSFLLNERNLLANKLKNVERKLEIVERGMRGLRRNTLALRRKRRQCIVESKKSRFRRVLRSNNERSLSWKAMPH
ncbi:hypothetical protein ACS0TY_016248 [Phlomoides rotata]